MRVLLGLMILCFPLMAGANMIWPGLEIAAYHRFWEMVLVCVGVEMLLIHYVTRAGYVKSFVYAVIINAASWSVGYGFIGHVVVFWDMLFHLPTFGLTNWMSESFFFGICSAFLELTALHFLARSWSEEIQLSKRLMVGSVSTFALIIGFLFLKSLYLPGAGIFILPLVTFGVWVFLLYLGFLPMLNKWVPYFRLLKTVFTKKNFVLFLLVNFMTTGISIGYGAHKKERHRQESIRKYREKNNFKTP